MFQDVLSAQYQLTVNRCEQSYNRSKLNASSNVNLNGSLVGVAGNENAKVSVSLIFWVFIVIYSTVERKS